MYILLYFLFVSVYDLVSSTKRVPCPVDIPDRYQDACRTCDHRARKALADTRAPVTSSRENEESTFAESSFLDHDGVDMLRAREGELADGTYDGGEGTRVPHLESSHDQVKTCLI